MSCHLSILNLIEYISNEKDLKKLDKNELKNKIMLYPILLLKAESIQLTAEFIKGCDTTNEMIKQLKKKKPF